jgi:hypothetical protein
MSTAAFRRERPATRERPRASLVNGGLASLTRNGSLASLGEITWPPSGGNGALTGMASRPAREWRARFAPPGTDRSLTLAEGNTEARNGARSLRLIRFGGHLPKGGYDVQNDGRASEDAPATPAV